MTRRDGVLVGVAAVLAVAAVGLGLHVREERATERARTEAGEAARIAVPEILSYDHRRMSADVAQAEQFATGDFLDEYSAATETLEEQAEAGDVVVTASVVRSAVETAGDDRVTLLMFVDQRTTRTGLDEPRLDQNRLRVTLDELDGRWLVSALEAL